jgi:hypothetical protein
MLKNKVQYPLQMTKKCGMDVARVMKIVELMNENQYNSMSLEAVYF